MSADHDAAPGTTFAEPLEDDTGRTAGALQQRRRRLALAIVFALTCAALVVGCWGFAPYFALEHRRMEPWKVGLVWIGDALAFAWFVRFVIQHVVHAEPLRTRPWEQFKRDRAWLFPLASLLLGTGFDLATTLWLKHADEKAFDRGAIVQGEVYRLHAFFPASPNDVYRWDLHCRYQDAGGAWHEQHYLIAQKGNEPFPPGLEPEGRRGLAARQAPFALRVRYDPDWPGRSWPDDYGHDDGNRLHYFSLGVLAVQGLGLLLFLVLLAIFTKERAEVPWWFDLYQAYPFFVQVIFFALVGPAHRASDFWAWI